MESQIKKSQCDIIKNNNIIDSDFISNVKCKYISSCIEEIVKQTNNNDYCVNKYKTEIYNSENFIFYDINYKHMKVCNFKIKTKDYYETIKNHLLNLLKIKEDNNVEFYTELHSLAKNCPAISHFTFKLYSIKNLPVYDFKFFEKKINDNFKYMLTFNKDKDINDEEDYNYSSLDDDDDENFNTLLKNKLLSNFENENSNSKDNTVGSLDLVDDFNNTTENFVLIEPIENLNKIINETNLISTNMNSSSSIDIRSILVFLCPIGFLILLIMSFFYIFKCKRKKTNLQNVHYSNV